MKQVTILLDEGHYKDYPGKRSPIMEDGRLLLEWEFARKLGAAIKAECDSLGIKCIRTTNAQNEKSLTARVNTINHYVRQESEKGRQSLMISLHGNAAGSGNWMNGKGWEVWTTTGTTNSDKFAKIMCDIYPTIFPESQLKGTSKKFPLRGHKEKNFTVIYKTACPCVLTENFFYDNQDECMFMLSQEGLDRIVKLHIESIKKWVEY